MSLEHVIWIVERSLWTGGRLAFAAHMAPDCLIALPMIGILPADQVLDRVDSVPKWPEVELALCQSSETLGTAVLGYQALASRPGVRSYAALCTSTYRRDGGMWKLIQHQQSPLPGP